MYSYRGEVFKVTVRKIKVVFFKVKCGTALVPGERVHITRGLPVANLQRYCFQLTTCKILISK